jgi:hypothetical protein
MKHYIDWEIAAVVDSLEQQARNYGNAITEDRRAQGLAPIPDAHTRCVAWRAYEIIHQLKESNLELEAALKAIDQEKKLEAERQVPAPVIDQEKSKVPKRRKKSDQVAE